MNNRLTNQLPVHLFLATLLCAFSLHAAESPFTPPEIKVPEGFTVEVAAAPPLVKHPMMAGFDDAGRLFIAESAGENLPRADLEKRLPNFIRMIEDTNGDGRFDKSTIFADKLAFPMGALWYRGSLYVASPPSIWKLTDTDHDGVADKREELVSKFGYTGNAADIHGPFLSPNGRFYWCDGRHGHEIRDAAGKIISQGKAARIFSCRPDGTDVEVHCGGGMDNPVEVDFTPEGEMLGTVNLMYRERGDCLVHWVYGGVYPRYDQPQVVAEFKRTGDLLGHVLDLGHVAVSGLTRYRGPEFGASLTDQWFITEFNTHKVVVARTKRSGSTFTAVKEEFLSSTSGDFHPTDVLEDADGSLLVVDTGGWFRIGCPVSKVAKPDVPGAIYRVRRKDAKPVDDPRGLTIGWRGAKPEAIATLLGDKRFAVRERAIDELAQRGESAVFACKSTLERKWNEEARRNAIWALTRIGTNYAQRWVREGLSDDSASVRQAAAHSVATTRDELADFMLLDVLKRDELPARREAATALAHVGKSHLRSDAIFQAIDGETDQVLEHALLYGLIGGRDIARTFPFDKGGPKGKRALLLALDQGTSKKSIEIRYIQMFLGDPDPALRSVVLDIISRHPEWAEDVTPLFRNLLREKKLKPEQEESLRASLLAFARNTAIQTLVAETLAADDTPLAARELLFDVIGRSELRPLPASWVEQAERGLASDDPETLRQAIAAVSTTTEERFSAPLAKIAAQSELSISLRVSAISALASRAQRLENNAVQLLIAQVNDEAPVGRRLAAARALGVATLTPSQSVDVARLVTKAGPLEIGPLMGAFERANDAQTGKELIAALEKSPGLASLSVSQLEKLLARFPAEVQTSGKPLLAKLAAGSQEQLQKLEAIHGELKSGSAERGREVYMSTKTNCAACHRIKDQGGQVGPDLSTIGQRRNRRDLLEAVVFPSASLARGYESYTIATTWGQVHTGAIVRETANSLELRTTQQTEVRIRRGEIERMQPSPISIMPAGLETMMTIEELSDLLAYLQSLK